MDGVIPSPPATHNLKMVYHPPRPSPILTLAPQEGASSTSSLFGYRFHYTTKPKTCQALLRGYTPRLLFSFVVGAPLTQ